MKLWLLALVASLACTVVNAAPFYDGKTLAHPLIHGLQESSATLAFIEETGGIKGYYCVCDTPDASPRLLDDFGLASIESVFIMSLDSEDPTRFVLFRQKGSYKVYAYKYDANDRLYNRVTSLQKALDRITKGQKRLDALTVKKALTQITPLNYRFHYEESGVPEFDKLDFSQGELVGYFGQDNKPLSAASPGTDQYFFKKTYQKKNGSFLTVTFWRGINTTLDDGNRTLYNYQVNRIAWETAPEDFNGSEEGNSVSYDFGTLSSKGTYKHGARNGQWFFTNGRRNGESGGFVNGMREGQWTEYYDSQISTGEYRNDLREGRWINSSDGEAEWATSGFQTYAQGQLNGPTELTSDGITERGNYLDGKRKGQWETKSGIGNYTDGLQSGQWRLKADKGHSKIVNFVGGKKEGELRETDANGVLILVERYKSDVLSGARESYSPTGKMVWSQSYENGKLEGRSLGYSNDGQILRTDFSFRNGQYDGPHLTFLPNGTPATVGRFEMGRFIGLMKQYDDDGVIYEESNWCLFQKKGPTVDRCGKHRRFSNGKLVGETNYLFGSTQDYVSYDHKTGRKTRERVLSENDHVTERTYHDNGQIDCQKNLVGFRWMTINQQQIKNHEYGPILTGEQLCYHRNGVVKSRAFYDKGLVGCTTQYDETGQQTYPGPEGCPKPVAQEYFPNFSS
ncbi:toxin-antitoxin system YwqK family antitoxin [Pseudomonas silesiensis]|uniref:toxin-antitoxin system YwqK family antitoxin n=1 Tax=Pseudomonas silesiensis TaxID=1853130 RepID=UPI0034D50717